MESHLRHLDIPLAFLGRVHWGLSVAKWLESMEMELGNREDDAYYVYIYICFSIDILSLFMQFHSHL